MTPIVVWEMSRLNASSGNKKSGIVKDEKQISSTSINYGNLGSHIELKILNFNKLILSGFA